MAVLFGTVSDMVRYSSVVPEQSLWSFRVDRITAHLPLQVSLSIIRFFVFFFPHFCVKSNGFCQRFAEYFQAKM